MRNSRRERPECCVGSRNQRKTAARPLKTASAAGRRETARNSCTTHFVPELHWRCNHRCTTVEAVCGAASGKGVRRPQSRLRCGRYPARRDSRTKSNRPRLAASRSSERLCRPASPDATSCRSPRPARLFRGCPRCPRPENCVPGGSTKGCRTSGLFSRPEQAGQDNRLRAGHSAPVCQCAASAPCPHRLKPSEALCTEERP